MALQSAPDDPYVVVIVGDGALTSGPSYEAMNNIVHVKPKRLIVVLNDNGWSISENVGWLAHWRNRFELHPTYQKFVEAGHSFFKRLPKGDKAWELARKLKSSVEGLFLPEPDLGRARLPLRRPRQRPRLPGARGGARARPGRLQGRHAGRHPRADPQGPRLPAGRAEPLQVPPARHARRAPAGAGTRYTYSQVFAKTLITMMEKDPKIVAISAAMLEGTGLIEVKKAFPDRVFDVGIAEEHAVIMAARNGQGGVEAGRLDLLDLPPALLRPDHPRRRAPEPAASRSASTARGSSATTARRTRASSTSPTRGSIPNMTVAAPKDENELQHMLYTAITSGKPLRRAVSARPGPRRRARPQS